MESALEVFRFPFSSFSSTSVLLFLRALSMLCFFILLICSLLVTHFFYYSSFLSLPPSLFLLSYSIFLSSLSSRFLSSALLLSSHSLSLFSFSCSSILISCSPCYFSLFSSSPLLLLLTSGFKDALLSAICLPTNCNTTARYVISAFSSSFSV